MTTIVNDARALVGVFTDGDVRRAFDNNADIHQTSVHQVMSKNPKTISREMLAAEALGIMETYKITSLVVTNEEQQPVGIIHIHDILRAGVI
jgi:arabinose-5-phosphate isomerase